MCRLHLLLLVLLLAAGGAAVVAYGDDRDDGAGTTNARALDLTNLYVFREGDQTGVPGDNANLVLILCARPYALPRQPYAWATDARYELHVTRVSAGNDGPVTATDDVLLRFEFGAVDANGQQPITVTAVRDGSTASTAVRSDNGLPVLTRALAAPSEPASVPATSLHPVSLHGSTLTVFSGLREDPTYFDREQYLLVRSTVLGLGGGQAAFRTLEAAVDVAKGYNVNAIVVRVPISFLQGTGSATTFDVWGNVSRLQ
jgi:hypothetical protein